MKSVLLKTTIFRVVSLVAVQTYFVPDEYWQSIEVAHFSVFGYGYRTWEFREEIRSAAYPCIFATAYKLLSLLNLDFVWILVHVPRILQAVLSALSDTCYFYWCRSFNLPTRDIWTVIVLDWFSFFCCSRTLINTFEKNLVIFGLYAIPWRAFSAAPPPYLFAFLVSAICFIRPTASLLWGPFCLLWLIKSDRKKTILTTFFVVGALTVLALCLLDSIFYGHFTFTPWNFFRVNVLKGVSSFYGSHSWHWYFSQGIPVVLGAFFLPFLLQVYHTARSLVGRRGKAGSRLIHSVNSIMLFSIAMSLLAYSLVPHKEFRFLLPLQPMMMFLALQGLAFLRSGNKDKVFRIIFVVAFFAPVLLCGQFHQRASLTVMKTLSSESAKLPNSTSLLFLMPCHSTPLYSHLHVPVPARFITCEPPLKMNTQDESQVFYSNPKKWLENYLTTSAPSHIIMFDKLAVELNESLRSSNFILHEKHFHTFFPEGRVSRNINIYRHKSWQSLLTWETSRLELFVENGII